MSGEARDFNNMETRALINFFSLQGKAPKEIHAILIETLGEHAQSYATAKSGWPSLNVVIFPPVMRLVLDDPKVTTPEITDQIHKVILEGSRISAKSIAEHLGISRERFGSVIHEHFDMWKLFAKWVPKCLNADQKRQRWQPSEQLLEFFGPDPNDFLSRLVTMDETWLYHYDPETKQQSMEWRHSSLPRPKNSVCKNPLEKFSPRFFGIKTASFPLSIFQRTKLSTRSITHLCWYN